MLISAELGIDRILHFVFHDEILKIYWQHWFRKFYLLILSKCRQIKKKRGTRRVLRGGPPPPPPPPHTHTHTYTHTPLGMPLVGTTRISNSNGIRTHNHLVRKQTLNYLVKLTMIKLCHKDLFVRWIWLYVIIM